MESISCSLGGHLIAGAVIIDSLFGCGRSSRTRTGEGRHHERRHQSLHAGRWAVWGHVGTCTPPSDSTDQLTRAGLGQQIFLDTALTREDPQAAGGQEGDHQYPSPGRRIWGIHIQPGLPQSDDTE